MVNWRQIKRSHLAVKRMGIEMELPGLLRKLPLLVRAKSDDAVLKLLSPNPSGLYFSYDEP